MGAKNVDAEKVDVFFSVPYFGTPVPGDFSRLFGDFSEIWPRDSLSQLHGTSIL